MEFKKFRKIPDVIKDTYGDSVTTLTEALAIEKAKLARGEKPTETPIPSNQELWASYRLRHGATIEPISPVAQNKTPTPEIEPIKPQLPYKDDSDDERF